MDSGCPWAKTSVVCNGHDLRTFIQRVPALSRSHVCAPFLAAGYPLSEGAVNEAFRAIEVAAFEQIVGNHLQHVAEAAGVTPLLEAPMTRLI